MSKEIAISMSELTENQRYGLILRGVQIGLREIGITGVAISTPTVKDGKFIFSVGKDE